MLRREWCRVERDEQEGRCPSATRYRVCSSALATRKSSAPRRLLGIDRHSAAFRDEEV